jgi:hypothetical protein
MKRFWLALPALAFAADAQAAPFTTGSLVVFQTTAASINTTAAIVELNPNTAGQSPSNSIAIDGLSAPNALRFSGADTSSGYLSLTNDRSLLTFTGFNSTMTSGNANTLLTRGVGSLNSTGTFTLQTTYTGQTGNQARSATAIDNANWFISDQGGIYTGGSGPAGNPVFDIGRAMKAFGGTVYVGTQSTVSIPVARVTVSQGAFPNGLPGISSAGAISLQDFYFVQSGANGATYDQLYFTNATSATAGTILKYSLVGNTWNSNGSYTTTFGAFGIAAAHNAAGGTSLYVTTGNGATANNALLKLTDTAGYNTAINITTANNLTLYTASGGATLKGVEFSPVAVPEPGSLGLLAIGAILLPGCFVQYRKKTGR